MEIGKIVYEGYKYKLVFSEEATPTDILDCIKDIDSLFYKYRSEALNELTQHSLKFLNKKRIKKNE